MEGYRSPLVGVTAEEATALLAVSVPATLGQTALSGALIEARLKLLASLPPSGREAAANAAGRFYVDSPPWFRRPELVPHLGATVDAVRRGRRLRIVHQRAGDRPKTSMVCPLGLVSKAGVWYLVARSGAKVVAHRASRIVDADVVEETFERPADFDLAQFWARWTSDFEANVETLPVTVRLSPEGLNAVREVLGEPAAAVPSTHGIVPEGDGWQSVVLNFASLADARRRLLSFGPEAEVIGPAEVRAEVGEAATKTARIYRRAGPWPRA